MSKDRAVKEGRQKTDRETESEAIKHDIGTWLASYETETTEPEAPPPIDPGIVTYNVLVELARDVREYQATLSDFLKAETARCERDGKPSPNLHRTRGAAGVLDFVLRRIKAFEVQFDPKNK